MLASGELGAGQLRAVFETFTGLLRAHREVINRLNVYPVPDGDTGTNMNLTMESVVNELNALDDTADFAAVTKAVAHGSLMGARGNSGVILSQMLRGLCGALPTSGDVRAADLIAGLERADESARQAVVRVVEGTMLSVARGAASTAREGTTLLEVARAARSGGALALAKTPEQLPVLAQAGVVDSGGTGLTLLYDALCYVLGGDELPEAPDADTITVHVHEEPHHGDGDVSELRYEVMFLLDADDAKMGAFRDVWAGIGDSIVVVGGEGLYNCHIHTDEIGAAIEAGIDVGRPYEIRVTDLAEQVVEEKWVREHVADQPLDNASPAPETAVVAVVAGDGVARIYRTLGVREIVTGGQSMNPSTADLVRAVERTGSSNVVILPNNKNIHAVAREVDNLTSVNVAVVPTTSIVEGFAALLNYDPAAALATNESGMTSAADQVVTGEITQAVRDTTTDAGEVHVGDWIGLSAEGIVAIADSIAVASSVLLDRLVTPEHELVTILEGEGSSSANTRRITDFLAEEHPHVGVEVHHGGQPLYPYFFGVE